MSAAEQTSSPQKQPYRNERDALEKSITLVRQYADRFEHEYARPMLNSSWLLFERRPALAIFIAIFTSLSFIPVVSFLALCIFVIVTFTTVALGCACAAISVVLLALSSIIISILSLTFLVSFFLTILGISSYMFFRLAALLRQDGYPGISTWIGETKQQLFSHAKRARDTPSEKQTDYRYPLDDSIKAQD